MDNLDPRLGNRMVGAIPITESGPRAVRDAMEALRMNKHVVFLGSGISLDEEVELKHEALKRGLLFLGPDCVTSNLDGKGFGIWNSVHRGPIGVIGTQGTGVQEASCLIDEVGISHALSVGPRDLSQKVNGLGTISALKFLTTDESTKAILVIASSPPTSVARKVLDTIERIDKPTVVCFLGMGPGFGFPNNVIHASTLEDAAARVIAFVKKRKIRGLQLREIERIAKREYERLDYGQKYIRGLFSGGALCYETMLILRDLVGDVYSNVPLNPRLRLPDPHSSQRHTCIDFESGRAVYGPSHPAIDLKPRCNRIMREAKDWELAVMVLDVILGRGAHPDPAGRLGEAIKEAKNVVDREGGYLSVVASIVGTNRDPQNLEAQRKKLERVGVAVVLSNAQAARIAALIAKRGKIRFAP